MKKQVGLVRAGICRFASLLYRDEMSLPLLEKLSESQVALQISRLGNNEAAAKLHAALARMSGWIQSAPVDELFRELRHDYAQLFLNAGQNPTFPYASCYASGKVEPLLMQEPLFRARKAYHASGLHKNPAWPDLDDHIAVELEFIAYLARQAGTEKQQAEFLDNHLLPWAEPFCTQLADSATTDFYKGLAELTMAALTADEAALAALEPLLAVLNVDAELFTLTEGAVPPEAESTVKTHCYICAGLCGQEVKVKDGVIVGCKGLAGDPKGGGRL